MGRLMHPSPRSRTRTRLVVLAVALVLFGAAVWIGAAVGHREPSRGLRGGANGMLGFVRATVTSTGFGIGAPTHFEQSLNTVTLTGTGERVLSRGQDDVWYGRATWSPDGQQAAFATWVQTRGPGAVLGGARVQVLDVPTGKVRTIWTCPGGKCPHELQWSPDGQVIAYSLSRWIGLIRPDGRPVRRVFTCETDACQSLDEGLSWAPDGSRLAISATSGDEVGGIFTIERNGSGLRQITKCFTTECGFGGDSFPAWSPDGS